MSSLDRVGALGGLNVRLAKFRPAEGRYQHRLLSVSPSEGFIAGDQFQLNAVPDTQVWNINEWSGGEGNDLYVEGERSVYNRSSGVRPKPVGEGLVLGALGELTKDSGGATDFADGTRFGYGNLTSEAVLWVGAGLYMYEWNPTGTAEQWGAGVLASTGTPLPPSSMADTNSAFLFTTGENAPNASGGELWKWDGSTQTQMNVVGAVPLAVGTAGKLWTLQYDNLYLTDQTSPFSNTLKVDLGTSAFFSNYSNDGESMRRLSTSDVGPIWVQRVDSGKAFLWEFNVATDVGSIIGVLPTSPVFPYSVGHFLGAHVVSFRQTFKHERSGDAFLYVQRGDTRTVVPIRSTTGSTAGKRVLIAGLLGSDLMMYFDGAVWAYNLDTGGIYMVGLKTATGEPTDAAVADGSVFLAGVGASGKNVERFRLDQYMSSGTLESGRFDVRYPGLPKLLTEVTVTTEPLAASTSVQVAVATDGGSYVALSGAHDVDGATSKTFVASTASTSIVGREFELRLTLAGTSTATPTVRSVAAMVTGAAHLEEWVVELDMSDVDSPSSQAGWDMIDRLRTLASDQQVVTFVNPWEQRGVDGADMIPVRVMDVILPQGGRQDAYATVRLRRSQLVVAP